MLLMSRGQRTILDSMAAKAPVAQNRSQILPEASIAAACVTSSTVAICLVPSRAAEMVSGARLGARVFERKLVDAPSLEDCVGLSLRQCATAAEAHTVLRSLVSAGARTAAGDAVAAKVTAAIARAPQLLRGFHTPEGFAQLVAGARATQIAADGSVARAVVTPATRAESDGLRDLTAALAVAGALMPRSAHHVLARSSDASSARSSALQSTRQGEFIIFTVHVSCGSYSQIDSLPLTSLDTMLTN